MQYPEKIILIINLTISSTIFLYESRSLISNGFTKHFENPVNYIDFFGHLSGIIFLVSMILGNFECDPDENEMLKCNYDIVYFSQNYIRLLNVFWTFSITIRGCDLFSLFNSTRQLYQIVKVSVKDISAFMALTIYIVYVFAVVRYFQLLLIRENPVEIKFIEESGLVTVDALGGFDTPGVGADHKTGEWVIFLMLQIITNIVVLNTLIAILGDSYDNVQNDAVAYDMR